MATNSNHIKAHYTVPHTQFTGTETGFRVTFNRMPQGLYGVIKAMEKMSHQGSGFARVLTGLIALTIMAICGLLRLITLFFPTTILVDQDTITVGRRSLQRADFGNFHIGHTVSYGENTFAVLSYSYGNRSFAFGGLWPEKQATEVASALNTHLRLTPAAGDENRASPDSLRASRPTDF